MSSETVFKLPKDFLSGPPPNPTRTKIDFKKTNLPEYDGLYATVLDGILTPEECRILVAAAEDQNDGKWERAMVNIGGGMQAMYEDTRKCGRIIFDSQEVVDKIWERVKFLVPELHNIEANPLVTGNGPYKRREVWEYTRCNERMRFLKYTAGEYFKPHCDGMYETPDKRERTYYTLHLYLNDTDTQPGDEPLDGGATTFWGQDCCRRFDVAPKIGSVLIFQQRFLLHSGDDVVRGMKMTMRTELMFAKAGEEGPEYQARPPIIIKGTRWVKSRKDEEALKK